MPKRALITGITGQDGSYLTEWLLSHDYEVHGIIRRASSFNTGRLDHIYQDPHSVGARLYLHHGDLSCGEQLNNLIYNVEPEEIYHLGGAESRQGELRGAGVYRGRDRTGYDEDFGGGSSEWNQGAFLPSEFFGDVRERPSAAERNYAVSAAQSLRSGKGLQSLDDG